MSRFLVGIDLGTSNTALSYCDLLDPMHAVNQFFIPQLVDQKQLKLLPLLPTCLYLAAEHEIAAAALNQPWDASYVKREWTVGEYAKKNGALSPNRLIESSKSWLVLPGALKKEKIFPLDLQNQKIRFSPVEVLSNILSYLKEVWEMQIAKNDPKKSLEKQSVVITIPASFDEGARRLTIESAKNAGFCELTLLEEPIAALYAWLEGNLEPPFKEKDTILICDMGGGTIDFSWIEVEKKASRLSYKRASVGNHLLLGGDNIDLALAHLMETQLKNESEEMPLVTYLHLKQFAKEAKENFFGENPPKSMTFHLPGSGTSVIGGSKKLTVRLDDIKSHILDGFFPIVSFEKAIETPPKTALAQKGLPYEKEAAVTKHLAQFLHVHQLKAPTYVLFNGGTFKSPTFRKQILESFIKWFPDKPAPIELQAKQLDLSVSLGATYFARLKHQKKPLIESHNSRGIYLQIGEKKFLTLLPKGTEEERQLFASQTFSLLPNQPVSFQFFSSVTFSHGFEEIIEEDLEKFAPFPPLQTVLKLGSAHAKRVPVKLSVKYSSIGTLDICLESLETPHRWKLDFFLKEGEEASSQVNEVQSEPIKQLIQKLICDAFTLGESTKLTMLFNDLEKALDRKKNEWPLSTLRFLFDILIKQAEKRLLSSFYESRFWNLAGFFIRPGWGAQFDEERNKALWKFLLADLKKSRDSESETQFWICCRRASGGLSSGQQTQLFSFLFPSLNASRAEKKTVAYLEKLRALSSFESLDHNQKRRLGEIILKRIDMHKDAKPSYFCLSRIASRQLLWAGPSFVLPTEICEKWVQILLTHIPSQALAHCLALLGRKSPYRELNLSQKTIDAIRFSFSGFEEKEELEKILSGEIELTKQVQERFYGDSLPPGLILS